MALFVSLSESSLCRVAESLLAKISSSSIQQASLDIGVSHDLHHFKESLLSLKDRLLLLRFDSERQQDPELQRWLRKLKQVFYDAENMLDDIHCQSSFEGEKHQWLKALLTKVGRSFSSSSSNATTTVATQIKQLTQRLQLCAADIIVIDTRIPSKREIALPFVFDRDVIGGEIDKEIIIEKLLMHHHHDDQSLSVLPIVGMRGVGKTALAQAVLGDERIIKSFSPNMWVSFPHTFDFDIEQIIIEMINSSRFLESPYQYHLIRKGQLQTAQLLECLEKRVAGKKLLLVLDNVCMEDPFEWDEFMNLIPAGANGSKILLTTRSHSIASMTGTIPSHNLEPFSPEDSLFLFQKCATKAKRFPQMIEDSLERDRNDILVALELSYHRMPFHLKQCFELFSLYPNDFVFHSSEVVSLWAALDLLPSPTIGETLIDVSHRCLQELMPSYCLKEFVNLGTSYYFQIHDFVHNLARDMAKFECLMVNSYSVAIPKNVRHLSFDNDLFDSFFTTKYADVRTILFPVEGVGAADEDFLNMCMSRYRYLRILDLSDSTYEILPSSIDKLRHLRFLSLERNEKIKRVPDSICKLQNLQVLNLAGCTELKKFPKRLRNLASLRQLGITTKESTLPEDDIANLNFLEILNIESCDKLKTFFVGIKRPSLKTLEVRNCASLKYLPLDTDHFPQLETLLVDKCGYLDLTKRHDDQNSNLQLKAIRLHSLPQLVSLPRWLQKSANTLQSLLIVDCKNFEVLPECLSTFSVLGSFGMVNCPKLMYLPNDIHCLITLGYLRIEDCPELCRKCQQQVGEYWPKISHIKKNYHW